MKKFIGLALVFTVSYANAEDNMCLAQAYNYGLATNAAVNCKFKYWNDGVTEGARQCYSQAVKDGNTDIFQTALKRGVNDFEDKYKAATDKKSLCHDFELQFPDYVKN